MTVEVNGFFLAMYAQMGMSDIKKIKSVFCIQEL